MAGRVRLAGLLACVWSTAAWAQPTEIDGAFFSLRAPAGYEADWDPHGQILFLPEVEDANFRLIFVFYCSTIAGAPAPSACDKSEEDWIAWFEAGGNSGQPLPEPLRRRAGREPNTTEYFTGGMGTARDGGPPPHFSMRGLTRATGRVMVFSVSRASAADSASLAEAILASIQWRP